MNTGKTLFAQVMEFVLSAAVSGRVLDRVSPLRQFLSRPHQSSRHKLTPLYSKSHEVSN